MFTLKFWKDAVERAVATAAQAVIVLTGTNMVNATELDYLTIGGVAAGMAGVALLKALAASQVGQPDDASLLPTYDSRHAA